MHIHGGFRLRLTLDFGLGRLRIMETMDLDRLNELSRPPGFVSLNKSKDVYTIRKEI